jgi:hypothetical protein
VGAGPHRPSQDFCSVPFAASIGFSYALLSRERVGNVLRHHPGVWRPTGLVLGSYFPLSSAIRGRPECVASAFTAGAASGMDSDPLLERPMLQSWQVFGFRSECSMDGRSSRSARRRA